MRGGLEAVVRLVGMILDPLPHLLPPSQPRSTGPLESQEVRPSSGSSKGKVDPQQDALSIFRPPDCLQFVLEVLEGLMACPEVLRLHLPPGPGGFGDPDGIGTGVGWRGAATGAPIDHPVAIEDALKFRFSTRVLHLDTKEAGPRIHRQKGRSALSDRYNSEKCCKIPMRPTPEPIWTCGLFFSTACVTVGQVQLYCCFSTKFQNLTPHGAKNSEVTGCPKHFVGPGLALPAWSFFCFCSI